MRVKDPLGAVASFFNRTPVPFVGERTYSSGNWFGDGGTGDKTREMASYGAVGTLFQTVHSLAEDTSRVEWHMHRIRQRSSSSVTCPECEKPGVELLPDHQALRVWSNPNDHNTGQEYVEGFQQHIDLTGEGYWVIERLDGLNFPTGMWYVRPDRMQPVKDPVEYLLGWMYRGPDGQEVALELNQVVQLKLPNPLDPYRGMGPVQSLLNDIGASAASAKWTENFFQNSARPGGIIEAPNELSDTQFKMLRERWTEQHKGVQNAHRVAILEGGLTWKDVAYSPKDMILTDLRKFSSDQIRQAFGYPEFAAGILENANRASSEASAAWYTQRLIVPRLDRIGDALNYKFLKLFGSTGNNVEFAYSSPVPKNAEAENAARTSKAKAYATYVTAGVDPDDAAMVCGLPPMKMRAPEPTPVPVPQGAAA